MQSQGYIHLYTGNGKGKTTAAFGLALRMVGSGGRVVIIQFMKGQPYSELVSANQFDGRMIVEQYGSKELCVPDKNDLAIHRQFAERGLDRAREVLSPAVQQDDQYNLVVLDEIVTALFFTIVRPDDIFSLMDTRQAGQELVLTGRYAPRELIDRCDLVTEMKEIRHYYTQGVEARKGIEM